MMNKVVLPPHKGVEAVIYIGDLAVGGQTNATLNRTMTPISVTNKINGEWSESLSGVRGWSLVCNGMFIKNNEAFEALEAAFYNGDSVSVKITDNHKEYYGSALITRFPITVNYNETYTYGLTLLGTGELHDSKID